MEPARGLSAEEQARRIDEIEALVAQNRMADVRRALMALARTLGDAAFKIQVITWANAWSHWTAEDDPRVNSPERKRLVAQCLDLCATASQVVPVSPRPRPLRTSRAGPLLRAEHLSKRYPRRGDFELRDLSLTLAPGEITGLVGVNASGKSTLIRILAGDLAPTQGQVSLGDRTHPSPDDFDASVAWMPQDLPAWPGRLGETLELHAALRGVRGAENQREVDYWLERLDIAPWREARWTEISGGTRTRFALAAAMIANPSVLLLDEPLAALDLLSQQRVLIELRELCDDPAHPLAVLLSSQHIHEVEAVADRMICLDHGAVLYSGPSRGGAAEETVFELGWMGDRVALERALGPKLLQAERVVGGWIVHAEGGLRPSEVLASLEAEGAAPGLYRDLSRSLVRTLWERGGRG